jgi:diguanylate cyclase (GGDEF)-like protein/PAS domain S-box-containing protein
LGTVKNRQGNPEALPARGSSPLDEALAFLEQISAPASDLPSVLGPFVFRAQALTAASGAAVGIREGDHVVLRAAVGSCAILLGRRMCLDGSWSGLALITGQPVVCGDTRSQPPPLEPNRLESCVDMRSLLVVPFQSANADSGVLMVTSPDAKAFRQEQQGSLCLLGRLLANRLEHAEQIRSYQLTLAENDIALATLRESEHRFRSAFDHSGMGMALMSTEGRLLRVNPALCRTLGYPRSELLAFTHQAATHPDDRQLEAPLLREILTGERTRYELEKRYLHRDGSTVWGLLTVSVIATPKEQALYLVAQIQDITSRKANEQSLMALAVRDDLTGLWNRREMLRILREETSRADRHRRPLSLIMIDIDRFKMINDTYGHPAGDASLRQLARIVEDCVRSFDRVARYGGEEFAVILPETLEADALVVAERIRTRVASATFSIRSQDGSDLGIAITISSGIATMAADEELSIEGIIREADIHLYRAKSEGKNRCVNASTAPSIPQASVASSSGPNPNPAPVRS